MLPLLSQLFVNAFEIAKNYHHSYRSWVRLSGGNLLKYRFIFSKGNRTYEQRIYIRTGKTR